MGGLARSPKPTRPPEPQVRGARGEVPRVANDRAHAQPWTEWISRPEAGEAGEFTMACWHGSVTSEDVKQTYPPNQALGLLIELRRTTDLSAEDIAITGIRM